MSLGPGYFEALYAGDPNPWGFGTRWYERRKYAQTLAALPRERYRSGFEPGCSIGVLTELLAGRCDRLLATDPVASALAQARRRVGELPGVRVERGAVPTDWPTGEFDLIVLSELAYYLDRPTLAETLDRMLASLLPSGDLVVVHWRPRVPEYPLTGDQVHIAVRDLPELERLVAHEESDFLLDVFRKGPAQSVAAAEGLR